MKAVAVFLSALLSAQCLGIVSADSCVSKCRTDLHRASEVECGQWRNELPRPDLYSHCQDGYTKGREVSCDEFCRAKPNTRRLDSLRLDACTELKGRPPQKRMAACNDGYVKARVLAEKIVTTRGLSIPDEGKRAGISNEQPKRKLSINNPGSAKNVLEAAREEAVAAFQGAKSEDL